MASRKNPAVRDARPIPKVHPSEKITLETKSKTEKPKVKELSMTISQEDFDCKDYRIRKGKALVLNNKEFKVPNENLADRAGSDLDASTISQRLSELPGFENYELESDLTKEQTFKWFKEEKDKMKNDPVDCLILVVLSHGNEEGIYATDELMKTTELVDAFNATNCPELMFKPKVLIFQACRGTNVSYGVNVEVDKNQPDSVADDKEYKEWLGMKTIRLPNEADFLFAYAAIPGTGAFRNVETGSPFIKHLCEAIKNMEINEDVFSVLTTVNKMVGLTYQPKNQLMELNNVVQMPCFVSHLTKTLRLKQS